MAPSSAQYQIMIIAIADILVFIAITFVGDHLIGGFPSFILVWIALISYRLITDLEIQRNELKLQQIVFLLFTPYMILGIFRLDTYYYAFLQTVLYINVFAVLQRMICNKYSMSVVFILFSLMTVAVIMFGGGNRLTSNTIFIFGPNIMYRIYGVLFFVFFYTLLKSKERRGLLIISVFLLSFICMITTGSRGGIIILLMESLAVIYYFRKRKYVRYLTYLFITVLIYNIIQYWDILEPLLGRAVYFDPDNASERTRLSMYWSFILYLQEAPLTQMLFGLGNNNSYYPNYYPHNIVIEFIMYHGILFFSFIVIASTALIRALFVRSELRILILIYLPIIFGALVSGSFLDNFTVISLMLYCYTSSMKEQKQQITRNLC